ncbi:hypothetical protein OQG76_06855 [Streptococcus macedonicus]|uniref:Uncharacterized protein n=1 Tax=Streptococcus macedonicus TaxID=59310 RepID=A0AA47FFU4_STRMC|nr:hypothetical protein [Streptococcus macedonicus]MCW8494603.1 hypothetical protein [Streptococcus macedonicus]MCW8499924.1 hypothetical protein [Streptococcus macedonicus]MCW8501899.1 hypothetical protein [Streptococcus macedonicus]MCW8515373.1 hypothetical protein [Streptococcus macedonicus]MCW8633456.1 hypothetical protein [Streptococcus macedonicus]
MINNVEIAGWIDDESANFARLKGVILNALMLISAHTAIVG